MDLRQDVNFPVVAIGGSAGALEAFFEFFEAVSKTEGASEMAFVVVLHLSPDEESHLPDLLRSRVELPVLAVHERTEIEQGHIYVLPPGLTLSAEDGALVPLPRAHSARHRPVDDTFFSLSNAVGQRLVAVICSGTGTNGSAALGTVREADGCVIVQTPETAQFDEMPRHGIETGFVDMVLDPAEMVPALVRNAERLAQGDILNEDTEVEAPKPATRNTLDTTQEREDSKEDAFRRIVKAVNTRSSLDLNQYKTGTLFRRIDRRVHLQDLDDWNAYTVRVEQSGDEADALLDDLLITVTSFFRDAEAWDQLIETVLKPLVRNRPEHAPLRVWTAGCATGEEAYSVAIALLQLFHAEGIEPQLEVFATDASEKALARARIGRYPLAAVEHLPDELLSRWFNLVGDWVQIRPEVRDAMIFAPQNVLQDPPFSNVDLVICRNVLIYLKPESQNRLVRLCHFALKEGGCLFLGSAETVGSAADLYDVMDKGAHIWRRIGPTRHEIIDFPPVKHSTRRQQPLSLQLPQSSPRQQGLTDRVLEGLAVRYAPPSVVVDQELQIRIYHGDTSRYLRAQTGEATHNLLSLAREGIAPYLRRLIDDTRGAGEIQTVRLRALLDEGETVLTLVAAPIPDDDKVIISFLKEDLLIDQAQTAHIPVTSREEELEKECHLLREELAATNWSANRNLEETRAYNEEITSMNEELRAANEELETSKEELQSLNEELRTVNSQLHSTVSELRERTADLDNLLSSTGIATLFLDTDLMIRWYSPGLADLFRIREADTGRPVGEVVRDFHDDLLEDECRQVLLHLERRERNVTTAEGEAFVRSITPYRDTSDRIAGVVVSFGNVTEIQNARRYAERIVETVPMPLIVLNTELRIVSANPAFYRAFQTIQSHTENRLIYDLGDGDWNIPELRRLLDRVLPDNEVFEDYEVEHEFQNIGDKVMLLSGRRLDQLRLILLAIEDITDRRKAEAHQEILMGELAHRVKNALTVVQALASQTLRRSGTLEEFEGAFFGRLAAYSGAHSQLLERDWHPGNLKNVVAEMVESHAGDPDRVRLDGPDISVSSRESLALALILHELETNAVKYGSLSVQKGSVLISWSLDNGQLRLQWQEQGGPTVTAPDHESFGLTLIRQFGEYQLNGVSEFDFAPAGLVYNLAYSQNLGEA